MWRGRLLHPPPPCVVQHKFLSGLASGLHSVSSSCLHYSVLRHPSHPIFTLNFLCSAPEMTFTFKALLHFKCFSDEPSICVARWLIIPHFISAQTPLPPGLNLTSFSGRSWAFTPPVFLGKTPLPVTLMSCSPASDFLGKCCPLGG